jgi:adenine-specific DNA-methyltransferase
MGPYIVDFVSLERKLVVEIDGGQHNEEEMRKRDEERTRWLKERKYRVLRFWNNEALVNREGVLQAAPDTPFLWLI